MYNKFTYLKRKIRFQGKTIEVNNQHWSTEKKNLLNTGTGKTLIAVRPIIPGKPKILLYTHSQSGFELAEAARFFVRPRTKRTGSRDKS